MINNKLPLYVNIFLGFILYYSSHSIAYEYDGFAISTSRVIFSELPKDKVKSVEVWNDTDESYLLHSSIKSANGATGYPLDKKINNTDKSFFTITPPLSRVEKRGRLPLRIILSDTAIATLPKNEESIFFLSVQAIPSMKESGNSLNISLISNIKVFYRPSSIKTRIEDAMNDVDISLGNNCINFKNKTPLYLTFYNISVNNINVNNNDLDTMLSPSGNHCYRIPNEINKLNTKFKVSWSFIDEDGLPTKTKDIEV
ncbi:molecular chaperone [Providencia sneebia]|uniref:Molecular chaperone n=1 Tax=Providencia sneebia DSM 19967 TaxID=1141660 RepID=K8WK95_9GAMM|nr:molecular chaperone [Providencia sneebia]EKT60974.1 hypothetical protein OO7_02766 [Providencia sneebia DSM 19967]